MNECFWCGCVLDDQTKTRDHLISRPLKEYFRRIDKIFFNQTRPACKKCNFDRSKITSFFKTLIRRKRKRRLLFYNSWQKNKENNEQLLMFFRSAIVDKLPPEMAAFCLVEIDMILGVKDLPVATLAVVMKKNAKYLVGFGQQSQVLYVRKVA